MKMHIKRFASLGCLIVVFVLGVFLLRSTVGVDYVVADFLGGTKYPGLLQFTILGNRFDQNRLGEPLAQSAGAGVTVFVVNDQTLNNLTWWPKIEADEAALRDTLSALVFQEKLNKSDMKAKFEQRFGHKLEDGMLVCTIESAHGIIVVLKILPILHAISEKLKIEQDAIWISHPL